MSNGRNLNSPTQAPLLVILVTEGNYTGWANVQSMAVCPGDDNSSDSVRTLTWTAVENYF